MSQDLGTISSDLGDLDDAMGQYKRICPLAIISTLFGSLSVLALTIVTEIAPWAFAIVPIIGLVTGVLGQRAIKRDQGLTGRGLAKLGVILSGLMLVSGLSLKGYVYATEVPEGHRRLTYQALQPTVEGELFPESAKELDGQQVFIKGYMYPTDQQTGITEFLLCRDKGDCCFGGQPKLTDTIKVTLPANQAIDYKRSLCTVAGTFHVEPQYGGGGPIGTIVYQMDATLFR